MAFETGLDNKPTPIKNLGQVSGRLVKEDNKVVNVADLAALLTTPGSGLNLNVDIDQGDNTNEFSLKGQSFRSLLDTSFNVPLDTEKTWDLVVDGALQPASRNAGITAGGTTFGPSSTLNGNTPISTDTTAGVDFSTRWVLQSKKNIKFRNSDQTLVFISDVFADSTNSVSNSFSIVTYGGLGPLVSTNTFSQVDWNIDSFGAGTLNPSGITLDFDTLQTVVFHAIKKSMGAIKIGFVVGDTIFYAHEINITNTPLPGGINPQFLPFLNIDLPIRCDLNHVSSDLQVINYGIGNYTHGIYFSVEADTSVLNPVVNYQFFGAAAYALGESNVNGYPFTAGTKQNLVALVGPSRVPIVSLRLLELFYSNRNTIITQIKNIVIQSRNADLDNGYVLEVIYNGVLVGESFSDVDSARSGVEFDTSATSVTGGAIERTESVYPNHSKTIVFTKTDLENFINGLAFSSIKFNTSMGFTDTVKFANTITFAATPVGANANVGVDVNWEEIV